MFINLLRRKPILQFKLNYSKNLDSLLNSFLAALKFFLSSSSITHKYLFERENCIQNLKYLCLFLIFQIFLLEPFIFFHVLSYYQNILHFHKSKISFQSSFLYLQYIRADQF